MNARTHIDPSATRSQYPVEYLKDAPETMDSYLDRIVSQYRNGCACNDLTCRRLAAIALCREVRTRLSARMTYRAAVKLLTA